MKLVTNRRTRMGDALNTHRMKPRISRTYPSMVSISGFRVVIEAANAFRRYFAGQVTATGKILPAKVFIASLTAIGAAAGLGAIVRANDTRTEVAEQVKSMGGELVKVNYKEKGSGGGGYARAMSDGSLPRLPLTQVKNNVSAPELKRHMTEVQYRFNSSSILVRLLRAAALTMPRTMQTIRRADVLTNHFLNWRH